MSDPESFLRNISFNSDYPFIKPKLAMFNVVKRCNAGCGYCSDWQNDPNPNTDLPFSQISKIINDLKALGVERIMFSGGEPLLRKDIYVIMEFARSLGFEVAVITNGTALTRDGALRLAQMGAYKIGVSMDSLDPERFFRIRRLRLAKVIGAINILTDIRENHYPMLNIALFVTVNKINIDDLVAIADYAKQNGISAQYQPVHFSGSGTPEQVLNDLWPSDTEIQKLDNIIDHLISKKRSGYPINNRIEFLAQIPVFFRQKTFYPGDKCMAAYTDVVIDTELGVRPCWSMDPVAFLDDKTDIHSVWFSEEMKGARSSIRKKQCPGCLYACHINKSYSQLPSIDVE